MNVTIKQFSVSLFLLLLIAIYTLFSLYYNRQQNQTATVIVKNLKSDISNFSYILSKYVRKEPIETSRALLDRESANNDFIAAIAIFDGDQLLLSSDPAYSKMLKAEELYRSQEEDVYTHLRHQRGIVDSVHYYQGKKMLSLTLVYFLDQHAISEIFDTFRSEFFIAFVLIPFAVFTTLWLMIIRFVIRPLERLRQYAYYQSEMPDKFSLREMEYIRASLAQTFYRLEVERKELYELSRTDSLSGLANRNLLEERTTQIIAECKRHQKEFAILFLDLDHFKSVNDSLGHDVGDELLRKIAGTIQELLRISDVVARIGGDEFVIALTNYSDTMELIDVIDRIQKRILKTWVIQNYSIHISSSIGVSIYPKDGKDLLELMKNADIAMYKAKDSGRNQYYFFTEELNHQTQEYITLANSMFHAFENEEFELFYQPQNDVVSGEILGAEALIRWFDPNKGMIPPNAFIPIAEQNGFIIELGTWILEAGIKQKKRWETEGKNLTLSINIAAKQILEANFFDYLKALIHKYSVKASEITLEITEYIFLENNQYIHEVFDKIKNLGVKISLDDFGTGYSSLSYLRAFPIDVLKIDKSFLDDYDSPEGDAFLKTIISMAKTLNVKVVAEGVEHQAQVEYLKSLECNCYQGYVCSPPVAINDFNRLLEERKRA